MRSSGKLFITIGSLGLLCLMLPGSLRADNFTFSFTNTDGNVSGTVTGEIIGLTNGTGAASEVIITSYPSFFAADPDLASPLTVVAANSFTEVGGSITAYNYNVSSADGDTLFALISTGIPKTAGDTGGLVTDYTGPMEDVFASTVTFTATPEPSTVSLMLIGVGMLGLVTRKRIANLLRPDPGTHGSLSPH
jgi:hypothetical protein